MLDEDGQATDVFVQVDPAAVQSVEDLRDLPVGTVTKVPLGTVATVEEVTAQGSITRIDEAPAASISAEIADVDTGAVSQDVQTEIDALVADGTIPESVDVRLAGVTQQQAEAFGGLFFSMGVAILVVYVAMVLTFNSLITPFIILFSLPLATIGALPALYFTGKPLGRERAHRVPDADRDRGDQRDRPAGPRRTVAGARAWPPARRSSRADGPVSGRS